MPAFITVAGRNPAPMAVSATSYSCWWNPRSVTTAPWSRLTAAASAEQHTEQAPAPSSEHRGKTRCDGIVGPEDLGQEWL